MINRHSLFLMELEQSTQFKLTQITRLINILSLTEVRAIREKEFVLDWRRKASSLRK